MTFIEHVRALYTRAIAWWRPVKFSELPIVAAPAAAPKPLPMSPVAKFDELSGEFYFREAILDQLDYYMTCLARMKRVEPDVFAFYSKVGAQITPDRDHNKIENPFYGDKNGPKYVTPWFRDTLPAFGAICWALTAREDEAASRKAGKPKLTPRFFYFTKYDFANAPPTIERPPQGTIYKLTAYWDEVEKNPKGVGVPWDIPLCVQPDGRITLLRMRVPEHITIHHRRGEGDGLRRRSTFTRLVWRKTDPAFAAWAKEHNIEPEAYLAGLFHIKTRQFEAGNAGIIRITASRGDLAAAFSVSIKRMPYFFKDRDKVLNERGHRKRIFHIVRPFLRRSGTAVKLHFRGMRDFMWNGYRVRITIPGRDHHALHEFDVGAMDDSSKVGRLRDGLDMGQLGERWRQHMFEGKRLGRVEGSRFEGNGDARR